jgi:hypothetical protein
MKSEIAIVYNLRVDKARRPESKMIHEPGNLPYKWLAFYLRREGMKYYFRYIFPIPSVWDFCF